VWQVLICHDAFVGSASADGIFNQRRLPANRGLRPLKRHRFQRLCAIQIQQTQALMGGISPMSLHPPPKNEVFGKPTDLAKTQNLPRKLHVSSFVKDVERGAVEADPTKPAICSLHGIRGCCSRPVPGTPGGRAGRSSSTRGLTHEPRTAECWHRSSGDLSSMIGSDSAEFSTAAAPSVFASSGVIDPNGTGVQNSPNEPKPVRHATPDQEWEGRTVA
jgi:hypothetical protein